jgi:hypothetical protein
VFQKVQKIIIRIISNFYLRFAGKYDPQSSIICYLLIINIYFYHRKHIIIISTANTNTKGFLHTIIKGNFQTAKIIYKLNFEYLKG